MQQTLPQLKSYSWTMRGIWNISETCLPSVLALI